MLLYLRSSQKLLTRVDRHRARQGPITIDFRVFRLCRRTRAFITSLLDCLRQSRSSGRDGYRAAAHVPLPKITMSNSPSNRRFHVTFQRNTTRETYVREAAWARVIGAASPQVKRKNRRKNAFFPRAVDELSAAFPINRLCRCGLYIWGLPRILTPFG